MTISLHTDHHRGSGRPVVFLHGLASRGKQDWPDAEWAAVFTDRPRVLVDLPAHGRSPATGTAATSAVIDALALAVGDEEIDLVGYSLGARLAWDLAQHPSARVRRLVLGGLSAAEPFGHLDLAAARAAIGGGPAPQDPLTAMIVHMVSLPGARSAQLLDLIEGLAAEPFAPEARGPEMPVLLVGGVHDTMSDGIDALAALLPDARAMRVPGDHVTALHTAEFRTAVQSFLTA
ncbi:alpha/beta fold hydrolase [Microbacterium sp. LWH11-1.2]|uniref:alpha/beta fold hydrolase n=1 Tax=Microbacterium sp. LWH11-1.2 TaxID=3135258 RepID=UPI0031387C38